MSSLKQKYEGKRLSTDEAAQARMSINAAINQLESIQYTTGPDSLLLKWGTIKSWELNSERAQSLLKQYEALGTSASAMSQRDTLDQKKLLCRVIDEVDGIIQNDWDGDCYTKQQAKDYVMGYND